MAPVTAPVLGNSRIVEHDLLRTSAHGGFSVGGRWTAVDYGVAVGRPNRRGVQSRRQSESHAGSAHHIEKPKIHPGSGGVGIPAEYSSLAVRREPHVGV